MLLSSAKIHNPPLDFKDKYRISKYIWLTNAINKYNTLITLYQQDFNLLTEKAENAYVYQNQLDILHSFCTSLENLSTNSNLVYLSTKYHNQDPHAEFVNLRSQLINLISKLIFDNLEDSDNNIYDSYSSLDDNLFIKILNIKIIIIIL